MFVSIIPGDIFSFWSLFGNIHNRMSYNVPDLRKEYTKITLYRWKSWNEFKFLYNKLF